MLLSEQFTFVSFKKIRVILRWKFLMRVLIYEFLCSQVKQLHFCMFLYFIIRIHDKRLIILKTNNLSPRVYIL